MTHRRARHHSKTGAANSAQAAGDPVLLGNQAIESTVATTAAGVAQAWPFTGRVTGTIQTITVYVDAQNKATTLVAGIFANAKGLPGARLAYGSLAALKAGAWNAVKVNSAGLVAGQSYWLATLGLGGTAALRDRANGPCRSDASKVGALSALPTAWTTGTRAAACPVSAYAGGTATISAPPPTTATAPKISGSAVQGQILTATTGTWKGSPTSYTYQWQACDGAGNNCVNIAGGTTVTDSVSAAQVGHALRVVVTAKNASGLASARSGATAVVVATSARTNCAGVAGSKTPSYAALDACGFPSPDTTGVPAGTTLTPVESAKLPAGATWSGGELDISGANVTITGLNIDGNVHITGPNATLSNSSIHGSGDPEVLIYQNATNTLMQHDEITAPSANIGAVNNAGGNPFKISNSYLHDNCTGTLGPGDVDDNYMITDGNVPGCHVEDIYVPGGDQTTQWAASPWGPAGIAYTHIVHNTLLNPLGQTASIFLDNHASGPNSNVTENDNLMAGGGYVTYGDSNGDGSTNIVITNNRFSRLYYPDGGYYGAEVQNDAATTFSGNIWDDTLTTVSPNS